MMQSLSDSHGKAHLPNCVLHLCVMHIESFEHGSAAGPGVAICPGPAAVAVATGAVMAGCCA